MIARVLAWAVFAWAVFATVVSVLVERGNGAATLNAAHPDDYALGVVLLALAWVGVGVVRGGCAARAGWLLLAAAGGAGTAFLAHAVAVAAVVRGQHGAVAQAPAWVAMWLFAPSICALVFVPALWPKGRVESRWLRRISPVAVVAVIAVTVAQALAPSHLSGVGPGACLIRCVRRGL